MFFFNLKEKNMNKKFKKKVKIIIEGKINE